MIPAAARTSSDMPAPPRHGCVAAAPLFLSHAHCVSLESTAATLRVADAGVAPCRSVQPIGYRDSREA